MKKFLSILLATLMIVSLVSTLAVGAAADTSKASALTEEKNGRVYHYYESFDGVDVVQGADKVMAALGWKLPTDAGKASNHAANVAATESGNNNAFMYEVKNGRLYLRNRGSADEYMVLATDQALGDVFDGAYTVEYTMTYLPTSSSTADGYFSLVYDSNKAVNRYAEVLVRISGWGNNRTAYGTGDLDAGDVSTSVAKVLSMTAYRVDNDSNPTLYEKLCGNLEQMPGTSNMMIAKGSHLMNDVEMTVRVECDGISAPKVYINDLLVSDASTIRDDAKAAEVQQNFNALKAGSGNSLAFCLSAGIDCVVDEITVYTDRGATVAESGLYITEIATLPDNAEAPYIEIYNGSDKTVDLSTYVGGYTILDYNGTETTKKVAFGDYIGKALTLADGTVLENLSADEALLAPGEIVVVYPVDADGNVSELAATENGVTMAGFRAEYGLSDVKVLAVPMGTVTYVDENSETVTLTNDCDVDPNERRVWFVGADGKAVDSKIELTPSLAFGAEFDVSDDSYEVDENGNIRFNIGRDGDVLAGYSAHYLYHADSSVDAKSGLLISRNTATIRTLNNVGKLLDVQADYFAKLAAFRAGDYQMDGSLAITEYVPVTEMDAFDAFELTNLSSAPLNVYDFGLVSSGNKLFGGVTDWSNATLLANAPNDDIRNPTNQGAAYMLQPGDSVVVWIYTEVSAEYTIPNFRTYHGLDKDAVIVVAPVADEKSVLAENAGTVSYGVATKADIAAFLAGTTATVAEAVTSVTVPLDNMSYELDSFYVYTAEELYDLNPTIFDMMIAERFQGAEMLAEDLAEGASLEGYFTREEAEIGGVSYYHYELCEDPIAEEAGTYYTLKNEAEFYAFGNKQSTKLPVDYAVSFAYNSIDLGDGAVTDSVKASSYRYDSTQRTGMLPYISNISNSLVYTAVSGGAQPIHTLGECNGLNDMGTDIVNGYNKVTYMDIDGVITASISFNPNTCGDVYAVMPETESSWDVNGVVYQAGEIAMIQGNTVIMPEALAQSLQVNMGGATQAPTQGTVNEDTGLNLNMNENSIDPEDASSLSAVVIVSVVLGVALLVTIAVLVIKKKKVNE